MFNLMKYSSNYSETTGSLWFYSKDGAININFNANTANTHYFQVLETTVAQASPNNDNGIL